MSLCSFSTNLSLAQVRKKYLLNSLASAETLFSEHYSPQNGVPDFIATQSDHYLKRNMRMKMHPFGSGGVSKQAAVLRVTPLVFPIPKLAQTLNESNGYRKTV